MVPHRRPAAALVMLAALACGSSYVEPANAAGRYALVAYDGAPLPVPYGVVVTVPPGGGTAIVCDRALVGDTIDVGTMRFNRRLTFTQTCGGLVIPPATVETSIGSYTLADSVITFTYEIPAESPLGASYVVDAVRHGDALDVRHTRTVIETGDFQEDSTAMRYERVR